MTYSATVTQKGQVTIPVDIRRFLGLESYQKVTFVKTKKQVILKPSQSFIYLKGSVMSKKRYSDRVSDKKVSKFVARSYAKKNTRP